MPPGALVSALGICWFLFPTLSVCVCVCVCVCVWLGGSTHHRSFLYLSACLHGRDSLVDINLHKHHRACAVPSCTLNGKGTCRTEPEAFFRFRGAGRGD